jgi:hypothetical protein
MHLAKVAAACVALSDSINAFTFALAVRVYAHPYRRPFCYLAKRLLYHRSVLSYSRCRNHLFKSFSIGVIAFLTAAAAEEAILGRRPEQVQRAAAIAAAAR